MTIEIGMWVKKRNSAECGIVKAVKGHNASILWSGANRAKTCSKRSIMSCIPPRALVLEGSLDEHLESTRSEEDVLRTWLDSQGVKLAYKNVHSLDDIGIIGSAIGDEKPLFVHISCHGNHDDSGAYITLAPTGIPIYLNSNETTSMFKKFFENMSILFSACLLGRHQKDMEQFRQKANLGQIAAFTRIVHDPECMLFELLIYQGLLIQGSSFETAVKNAEEAMKHVGVRGVKGKGFVRVF